jgi:heme/copper-type cytochrome/quinol oxidase subunit 2
VDAIPGRVRAIRVEPALPGIFYGFCYELCGPGHREIPICVVVLLYERLVRIMKWIVGNSEELKELLNRRVIYLRDKETGD